MIQLLQYLLLSGILLGFPKITNETLTYRFFNVIERDGKVDRIVPVRESSASLPFWAMAVSQDTHKWAPVNPDEPYFASPIPFVIFPPWREVQHSETFYHYSHQPDITWLPNGDLLAIWYNRYNDARRHTEKTVQAARLRNGFESWDPAAEFFKADDRVMQGNSLFYDSATDIIHHFNGMGLKGVPGYRKLAMLHRFSIDNGVTWSVARPVSTGAMYQEEHQGIAGMLRTKDGTLIHLCDKTSESQGHSVLHISHDNGKNWHNPGGDILGIHAAVEELKDGRLLAFGRGQTMNGHSPMSISGDRGKSWEYTASVFPPIGGGQRMVLKRIQGGALLFVSFTNESHRDRSATTFIDINGDSFLGVGMFAALSYDEGKSWPVRKLLTPGEGIFDGGARTGVFKASPTRAEHGGYLAVTQTPDGIIHLISSRLHYRFNQKWLETPADPVDPDSQ